MKRSITLLLLFLGSVAAMGQKNIVGKVQDAQGEPIAYATVSLLTADSSLVTGAITDEKGAFSLNLPKRGENTDEKVETTSVDPRPLTPSPQAGRGSWKNLHLFVGVNPYAGLYRPFGAEYGSGRAKRKRELSFAHLTF